MKVNNWTHRFLLLGMLFSFTAAVLMATVLMSTAVIAQENQSLRWRGCGISKNAFMESCAEAYQKDTNISVLLSGGGATLGIEAAAEGGADIGGTCRACLKSRKENELDVKLAIVAWDALVAVVHPSNPVSNITREQVRQVLQQKITNWKELGGLDARIVVVVRRGKVSGVGYCTRLLILEDYDADYGPTAVRLNSSGPVEKLVERQPNAIAITGVSSAKKRELKVLSIDGKKPTVANIGSGDYPYYRPLYIAYKPQKNLSASKFVEWLLSPKGQTVIQEQGTVTLQQGKKLGSLYKHYEDVNQITNYAMISHSSP
ncbi:MAG: phosphate ABC transporter substrate-binding protein [Blastopirellula sp.]|nr:MAG: phosphate ABC transporter substrate-binding protein [Blastopirellula sp.]